EVELVEGQPGHTLAVRLRLDRRQRRVAQLLIRRPVAGGDAVEQALVEAQQFFGVGHRSASPGGPGIGPRMVRMKRMKTDQRKGLNPFAPPVTLRPIRITRVPIAFPKRPATCRPPRSRGSPPCRWPGRGR